MIVYGHRGAQGEAPENTIAGCRHAIDRGVRHLEIDLRLSKDMELVVIHDDKLKRTADLRANVADLTAIELSRLKANRVGTPWPGKKHLGVPTLHALYEACPEIESWQLELKPGRQQYNTNLVAALAEWLSEDHEGCIVTSSDGALVASMKQKIHGLNTGLVSVKPDPTGDLEDSGCNYLIGAWGTVSNPWLIRYLHRKKIHISAWTVNDASVIKSLHRMKVDSIITDYPSMALPLVAALER
jgi:glycerophosphoryl diester phosphodiesterase